MSETLHAATVVLLRDGDQGIETLLLRRNSRIVFGGMWVFPGGRIDPGDCLDLPSHDDLGAARRAAIREAKEEAGLAIAADSLIPLSHWTPPASAPKRFLTWFFVAPSPSGIVEIDQGEIHEHAWLAPAEALRRRNAMEIEMAPPTWVTLEWLSAHPTVSHALAAASSGTPERFETKILAAPDGPIAIWEGDVAYPSEDPSATGPRHRLWMLPDGWRYERT
jgi:8-oxo-dGTP pyrophosphatase MutT (NUDIX family)